MDTLTTQAPHLTRSAKPEADRLIFSTKMRDLCAVKSKGAGVLFHAGPDLPQHVFAQIDYLRERACILAYRDGHFKDLTNEIGI